MRNSNRTVSLFVGLLTVGASLSSVNALVAQDGGELHADPATGIVYRKQIRQVQRPVSEVQMTTRSQTVYTPKTVVETKPVTRTSFVPVTTMTLQPRLEGRWNPFRQPTLAYRHVPETRWEARSEVLHQTETRVKWEPETKLVQVPEHKTRMQNDQIVQYEPVGQLAPNAPTTSNIRPEIAARLRPVDSNASIQPITTGADPATASLATRERPRSSLQSGLRATTLAPTNPSIYGPPATGTSVAGLPVISVWR
ncbi:hypothetical protein LOC71_23580 [Rhodopirellula sp. JC740]|uniref:Secreted protein n=1 Tax=Rhodopirellula halodulae TaxID=2894198 RepID=A0ABS8NNW7_9BACT|nr:MULTISPECIES: hypothetical protein [unclassified Rhodopirellula]MCC9645271.1 hypothetical protein [Rhodopirellula sp. JC740]MCC9655675.1 hypothetical protein [Rhodopirellula sp. JC737]